ncbi:MAG TPA: PKD domain-containing protein, partial [Flavisolibacter sp.]|nr:PKD domain-containing protein [Flavisolibacter sp.]
MTIRSLPILLLLFVGIVVSCHKPGEDADKTIKPVFESDRQEISAGDSITFKDFSQGYATKWKWTFEGGAPATSNLSSPVVKYDKPGTYSVTVEVSNGTTTSTVTKKDYIKVDYNQVKAEFTTPLSVVFTSQTVSFKDSSSGKPQT